MNLDSVFEWLGGGLNTCALIAILMSRRQLMCACYALAWLWWNGGGGDGTKRRLKRWARKFNPVRRTAPQLT